MLVAAAVAELETATLPSLTEKWRPDVQIVDNQLSSDDSSKAQTSKSLRELAIGLADNIEDHRLKTARMIAHFLIMVNLSLAKAEDCILADNMEDATEVITSIDNFCKRNISISNQNIKLGEEDAKLGFRRFRSHSSIIQTAYTKYSTEHKKISAILEAKLNELSFLKEKTKSLRGKGVTTSSSELYQRAIQHVTGKRIEPRLVHDDDEFGIFYVYDIPIEKNLRKDRKYKRDLENRIHDAVSEARETAIGEVGINWVTAEVIEA